MLQLTRPAAVALVGYAMLALTVLLPIDMIAYDPKHAKYVSYKYSFAQRLVLVILLLLPFALGVYSVNCMMVGKCVLYSWVVALLTLVWSAVVILLALVNNNFNLSDVI